MNVSTDCVWCEGVVETSTHIFLHCELVYYVWRKLMSWLGVNFIIPDNLFSHFECLMREARGKALQKGF